MRPSITFPAPGDARSYWLQEALANEPGDPCPQLTRDVEADVCIIGGGYAGMWTALELSASEPSPRIIVLEADICGGGASGRNGGFISPAWYDLEALCRLFGEGPAIELATAYSEQVAGIGEFCEQESIDCWFHAEGALTISSDWQSGYADAVDFLQARGLDEHMVKIDERAVRAIVDTPVARSGILFQPTATIQPARLARGMRRVLLQRGVRIFEDTPGHLEAGSNPARIVAPSGTVTAEHVVLTTGAWATGNPGFRTRLVNVVDCVVATEPIPDKLQEIGWDSHIGLSDARDWIYYLRRTEDDRIVIGGGSGKVTFGGKIGRAVTHDRRLAEDTARGLAWFFPQLKGVKFDYAWGGPMDFSASFTPFFQRLNPGNVFAGLGFSGHGLAATRVGGKILSSLVLGRDDRWSQLPVVGPPLGHLPPEPLRWPIAQLGAWAISSSGLIREHGGADRRIRRLIASGPERYRDRVKGRR